jgi:hypothetical protein
VAALIDECVGSLPSVFSDMLRSYWKFVIVDQEHIVYGNYGEHYRVDGATQYESRIIRLHSNSEKETILHECGHAVDGMLNFPSSQDEFYNLYREYWDEYIAYSETDVAFHETMNSSEFFATMFQEYISNTLTLKNNIPEMFSYFEGTKDEYCRIFIIPREANEMTYQDRLSEYEVNQVLSTLSDEYIVPVSSTGFVPGNQSSTAMEIINTIIDIINELPEETSQDKMAYKWSIDKPVDYEDYESIVSYFEMYYGIFDRNFLDINTTDTSATMILYINMLQEMETDRKNLTIFINDIVSNTNSGEDVAMAMNFAKYINDNYDVQMNYSDINMNELKPGMEISAYVASVMFQKMCNAAGIECDIISGYISNDTPHVWNRIHLDDGTYKYFDVYKYYVGILNVDEYHYAVDYAVNWMVAK